MQGPEAHSERELAKPEKIYVREDARRKRTLDGKARAKPERAHVRLEM